MALTTSNPNDRPIVTTETSGATGVSVAIDYTTYYSRIATALETIATNSTTISSSLSAIKTDLDTMTSNSTTIKDLAIGTGIHFVSPYEWLGYMSLYKLYVEDSGAIGLTKLTEFKDKIKSLPTLF